MSRFDWGAASKEAVCFELRKRDKPRRITRDASNPCAACGVHPKRGDDCYYPSATNGVTNKIIGHKECVDRVCAEHTAKSGAEEREMRNASRNVIQLPPLSQDKTPVDLEALYLKGWQEGVKHAVSKGAAQEWLRGFQEGLTFITDHKQGG